MGIESNAGETLRVKKARKQAALDRAFSKTLAGSKTSKPLPKKKHAINKRPKGKNTDSLNIKEKRRTREELDKMTLSELEAEMKRQGRRGF